MKKVILTLSSLLVAIGAYAQGTVTFSMGSATAGPYDAPVYVGSIGGPKADSKYLTQLYAGPSDSALAAIGAAVPFRDTKPGYISATVLTIPSVAPGADARIQIKAWAVASGTSYEAASAAGGQVGQSTIFGVKTGGAGNPPGLPADLIGFTSFAIGGGNIPEPSILALGALGGLALLLRRRK